MYSDSSEFDFYQLNTGQQGISKDSHLNRDDECPPFHLDVSLQVSRDQHDNLGQVAYTSLAHSSSQTRVENNIGPAHGRVSELSLIKWWKFSTPLLPYQFPEDFDNIDHPFVDGITDLEFSSPSTAVGSLLNEKAVPTGDTHRLRNLHFRRCDPSFVRGLKLKKGLLE